MRIQELHDTLRARGANERHVTALLRAWAEGRPLERCVPWAQDFLPAAVRAALPEISARLSGLARVLSEHPDEAGAARLLVALADGRTVESVLLPRDGVCVSTQVGCAVGCLFCMTGRDGLMRQVGSAEIVAQVLLARARRPVKKVVFMGMGEPAHNLDNVLEAIDFLGTLAGIGYRNLVFSTVGDRRAFEQLPLGRVKPALALSLHTTRADLRERLLPRAPRISPEELVALADDYARASRYPIQYQWTLLEGVNDTDEEVEGIARLLAGKYALMNFIPFNAVEGSAFRRPAAERAAEMVRQLHRRGVLAKLRHSAGQAVDGGCGQLRARAALA
jgi:23S rRNA (adenine2503-C2)-methyltransferase